MFQLTRSSPNRNLRTIALIVYLLCFESEWVYVDPMPCTQPNGALWL
jgi:hypothetical protein